MKYQLHYNTLVYLTVTAKVNSNTMSDLLDITKYVKGQKARSEFIQSMSEYTRTNRNLGTRTSHLTPKINYRGNATVQDLVAL